MVPTVRIRFLTAFLVSFVVAGFAMLSTDSVPIIALATFIAGIFSGCIIYEGEEDASSAFSVSMFMSAVGLFVFGVWKFVTNPWTRLVASLLGTYWTETPAITYLAIAVGLVFLLLAYVIIPAMIGGVGGYVGMRMAKVGMHMAGKRGFGEGIGQEKMFRLDQGRILTNLPQSIEHASAGLLRLLSGFNKKYYDNLLRLAVARIENQGSLTPESVQWILSYAFPGDALVSEKIIGESRIDRERENFLDRLANQFGMSQEEFVKELADELNTAHRHTYSQAHDRVEVS